MRRLRRPLPLWMRRCDSSPMPRIALPTDALRPVRALSLIDLPSVRPCAVFAMKLVVPADTAGRRKSQTPRAMRPKKLPRPAPY